MTPTRTPEPQARAGCYCRISSDPNDKREGVDRQREDTAALCEVKGWQVVDVYVDNDRSASNGKGRPEWERLLADIAAGKIDAVAAWDQDRVNRMMDDFVAYKKLFVQRGIKLATSNNGDIDLSTPGGVLTATIKTAVSEHEVAMMRVRMKRAARQKAEQGHPKWLRAFGYQDGTHQPDPVTGPLVKQAYAAILAGASLGDICRLWNDAGAYTLRGHPWTPNAMGGFLRNPRNAGLRSHTHDGITEIVGKGTWPALVDESLWRTAQSVMDGRPNRAPGRKSVRKHLLTGVLGCGRCGHYLSGHWTKESIRLYGCKQCHGISIRAEHVEPMMYQVVSGRLAMPDAVDLLKAEIHDEAEAEHTRAELNALRGELEKIGVERGQRLLTGQQAKTATDVVKADIAKLELRQQDQERLRVFDGLPLGKPEVADAVAGLSPDRFRAVLDVLMTVRVAPVGKGVRGFDPGRVMVDWR